MRIIDGSKKKKETVNLTTASNQISRRKLHKDYPGAPLDGTVVIPVPIKQHLISPSRGTTMRISWSTEPLSIVTLLRFPVTIAWVRCTLRTLHFSSPAN